MNAPQVIENCEDIILFALEGGAGYRVGIPQCPEINDKRREQNLIQYDLGDNLRFGEMVPESMYAFAMHDDADRIYATSKDYLVKHPADIIGDRAETACIYDGAMKWVGMKRIIGTPKYVYTPCKAVCWYEYHFRMIFRNSKSAYFKRIYAFDDCGNSIPIFEKVANRPISRGAPEEGFPILVASIVEDMHRSGTMLAMVRDAREIKFAVPLDDYKGMFIGRDAPMRNGRRRSIIHWVASHLRKKKDGESSKVKKHVRGVDEIEIDGLKISITPNDKID